MVASCDVASVDLPELLLLGSLSLNSNFALRMVFAPKLTTIGGNAIVETNPNLEVLNLVSLTSILGSLRVVSTDVFGAPLLEFIG